MFTIYEYYDMDKIAEIIRTSRGHIYLPTGDGSQIELTGNEKAVELLLKTGIGKKGLTLRLTDPADQISFMWLAMQAA